MVQRNISDSHVVYGVHAPPARPLLRGFLRLGLILGAPIVALGFAIDFLIWLL